MNWLFLVLAGLLEVGWAVGLKYSEGFTRPLPSVMTVIAMVVGFYLLSLSMREIPLGTAYGIWVGIGAVGAAIAAPGVPVVCLIGDGGLQFSPGELRTALDEKLPITFVVWNNSGFREIAEAMRAVITASCRALTFNAPCPIE